MVETRPLTPPPHGYDVNPKCDFYDGSQGNTNENYLDLKFKVQDLLNRKIISFTIENPNVKNNLMIGHDGPTINAIEESEDNMLIQGVDQIKTLMSRIHEN